LLKIPDDLDGLQNKSNSNIIQQHQLQKRSSSAKISIQSLERVVELNNHILTGISVDIQAGQVVGIIGPSGSGKSTLLRAINRLWEPPGDSIFLDGEDITKLNVLTVRRRVGMLFQTPLLFDGKFMASMCSVDLSLGHHHSMWVLSVRYPCACLLCSIHVLSAFCSLQTTLQNLSFFLFDGG
jgi:ABC-type bacteriocin/lantibiotic exporter with double-glycine peptidase domain